MSRVAAVLLVVLISQAAEGQEPQRDAAPTPKLKALAAAAPEAAENPSTPEKIALGKQLFFDPRLSGDNTVSCATCHDPALAFGDGRATSVGIGGQKLARNSPTVLNSGFLKGLFWDGRAATLEEQALAPLKAEDEMHQDLKELERELAAIPGYVQQFQAVFGKKPDADGVARALAAFQRGLVTEPAPFDRYLAGDKTALSANAIRGLELFEGDAGCIRCHHGPMLSDGQFYRLGLTSDDDGRAKISGDANDRYRYRTPPLRNIAETAPYMHDGSLQTLDDVVTFYYRGIPSQGPGGLKPDATALTGQSFSEIPLLVEFLKSLSGKPPEIAPPLLPGLLATEPDCSISPAARDAEGFLVHTVASPHQRLPTTIRVLLPEGFDKDKTYPVIYVLPVEAGSEDRYGDGLQEVKRQDLHRKHQAIFVAPTFADLPWYADHPTKADLHQEEYFTRVVVPFVEQTYPVIRKAEGRLLLGFSKSGWGAWTLVLRHPDRFGRAVAWDAPLMLAKPGPYGSGEIFGTPENFAKYRVTKLLDSIDWQDERRLILLGKGNFQPEHEQIHNLMTERKLPHTWREGELRKHDWHSGWVAEAVELLLQQ